MSVEVTREPDEVGGPQELCCKCQRLTSFWYTPKDVALCKQCALIVSEEDIPTKVEWFKQWGSK